MTSNSYPRERPFSELDRRKRSAFFAVAAYHFIGFLFSVWAFFPGLMTNDSEFQLSQARSHSFTDWHPVIMSVVWEGIDQYLPGPFGLLLLLQSMYWMGFFLIALYALRSSPLLATMASLLPISPFIFNFSGVIWKDVLQFDCFVLAIGIYLFSIADKSGKRFWSLIAIGFLLLVGALSRHNSAVAAVPLVALILLPTNPNRQSTLRIFTALFVATFATAIAALGSAAILNSFFGVAHSGFYGVLFMFDLLGIAHRAGADLVPGPWALSQKQQILEACYDPRMWDFLWLRCSYVSDYYNEGGRWASLLRPWMEAIHAHPNDYLLHRLDHLATFFSVNDPMHVFVSEPTRTSLAYGFDRNTAFQLIEDFVLATRGFAPFNILFSRGIWLLASVALPVIITITSFISNRRMTTALLIAISGTAYSTPLVLISTSVDFRYIYWTVGAVCIASLVALCDFKAGPDRSAS